MNVLITGGAGFLGSRLAEALLRRGVLRGADGQSQPIDKLILLDVAAPPSHSDPRVHAVAGDISRQSTLEQVIDRDTAAVFHLAAIVSALAEADFDLGLRINVDATRLLLDVCRTAGHRPTVVFASSVAVFGGELPATVLDTTAVTPRSSYGTQKAIGELLICDYARKGYIDGRVLRLPTISVRSGRPNAAASSFASGIIREPLNGEPAVCPVDRSTRVWLMSPSTVIECLILAHDLAADAFGANRIVNLPGISVSAGEMVAALERVAGAHVAQRVRWERDPAIERIVSSWPGAWDTSRARAMGFPADESFDDIIRAYVGSVPT